MPSQKKSDSGREGKAAGEIIQVSEMTMPATLDKHDAKADDEYPGRTIADEDRSPRGLGWEYRRRGWNASKCQLVDIGDRDEFIRGYDKFVCTDTKVNQAMLRGIK